MLPAYDPSRSRGPTLTHALTQSRNHALVYIYSLAHARTHARTCSTRGSVSSKDENDAEEDGAGRKQGMMDTGKGKKGKGEKKRPGRDEDDMEMRGDEDMDMEIEMDEHGDGKRGRAPKVRVPP